jgi:IclR family acetate operon transcriptional repressor
MTDENKKVTAVDKALILLDLVGQLSVKGQVRMTDLVAASGFQRPTVHRLVATLKSHGLVTQDDHGFHLGGQVLALAAQAYSTMDERRLAKPVMQEFSKLSGQTVHLAILEGLEVVYIDKIESRQSIVLSSGIGWRGAIHCTALGKAMLAFSPDNLVQAVMDAPMESKTEHTLTTPQALSDALTEVRARGYAIDDRENEPEVRCVAAPILDQSGTAIAGISISGTIYHVTPEKACEYGEKLSQACAELSRQRGYNG